VASHQILSQDRNSSIASCKLSGTILRSTHSCC